MEDRILKVSLDDQVGNFSHFPRSNFFDFTSERSTSKYTFTSDPACKSDLNILYTNEQVELSDRTVAVMTSNPSLYIEVEPVPVLRFFDLINYPIEPDHRFKTNYLTVKDPEAIRILSESGIPHTIFTDEIDYAKSCYAVVSKMHSVVACIKHGVIPICMKRLDEELNVFHYEANSDNLIETVSHLSPRSYFMEAEHVINNKGALAYYGNTLDYLFAHYTHYFMEREDIECDRYGNPIEKPIK